MLHPIHASRHDDPALTPPLTMNTNGTGATFRARLNRALLGSTVLIYGVALLIILRDPGDALLTTVTLVGAAIAQTVALTCMSMVLAVTTPDEPDDERDHDIELRSTRVSRWIVLIGMFAAIVLLILQQLALQAGEALPTSLRDQPLFVGHILVLAFVGSEIVRFATLAASYRRGA